MLQSGMVATGRTCVEVFLACVAAVRRGELIRRTGRRDKEFHFQDWFAQRLRETGIHFDESGRNTYPDFPIVSVPEGYEVKGLGWPGRETDYDANSQVPSGSHNGREIYYVFGRYPSSAEDDEYPLLDLVLCHGDFLNAHHDYVHKNKSFKGFGSYGDIRIRDRKMYVAPTPFALTTGTARELSLIVREDFPGDERLEQFGILDRREADRRAVSYEFDLAANALTPHYEPNPTAGETHRFMVYRERGSGGPTVALAS